MYVAVTTCICTEIVNCLKYLQIGQRPGGSETILSKQIAWTDDAANNQLLKM